MNAKSGFLKVFSLTGMVLTLVFIFSWLGYFPVIAQSQGFVDYENRRKVLQKIDSLLVTQYVYPDQAKEYGEEFRKKYEKGDYDSCTDPKEFAEKLTRDLVRITHDKHFNFRLIESSDMGEEPMSSLHHPVRYHILGIKENKGFSKLEWLEGNIGYLDIRRFYYFTDVKDFVDAVMKLFSNANAIIIDLRENGGGSGDYLSSYFLEYPTQLNSWYSRKDDFLQEFWTSKVGTEPLTDIPLFLLTSKRTFSAAESFAYDMKVRKRATIVGDSSRGGAHSVDLYPVGDQFEIYIPTERAINPITGSNWEGTGVIPDVMISSESAQDTAILLARKAGAEFAKRKDGKLKKAVEQMQTHFDRAERFFRENRTERGQTALDSVLQIADEYQLINEFFMDVLAYNYFDIKDEQILYPILKKKIELFPESSGAYATLGYAYYKNNKKDLSVAAFKKVLELDPDHHNARKMIQILQNE